MLSFGDPLYEATPNESVTVYTDGNRTMIKFPCGCALEYEIHPHGAQCEHGYGWSVREYEGIREADER